MIIEYSTRFIHSGQQFAVVVSRYNRDITDRLLRGALQTLAEAKIDDSNILVAPVPGAWELPLATKWLLQQHRFAAIICLGTVVRGETSHDQHINRAVSNELAQLALEYETPVAFGLLTCENFQQAEERAGGAVGNKGIEATRAVLEMIGLRQSITDSNPTRPSQSP